MARIVITNADWKSMLKTLIVHEDDNFIRWARGVAEIDKYTKYGENTAFDMGIGVEYLYIPDHNDLLKLLHTKNYAYLAHAADVLAQHEKTEQNNDELRCAIVDAKLAVEIENFQGGK